jgi:hypothetical protein
LPRPNRSGTRPGELILEWVLGEFTERVGLEEQAELQRLCWDG